MGGEELHNLNLKVQGCLFEEINFYLSFSQGTMEGRLGMKAVS